MKMSTTVSNITASDYATEVKVLKPMLTAGLHFLHAPLYGTWQTAAGKDVIYYRIETDNKVVGVGMAIRYELGRGYHYYYSPYGPLATDEPTDLAQRLRDFFISQSDKKTLFVRFDGITKRRADFVLPHPLAQSTASLQPRHEWVLDISAPETTLWEAFHKNVRYHVRLGERHNAKVSLEKPTDKLLEEFYELLQTTAGRNQFGIMPKKYYQAAFETIRAEDAGFIGRIEMDGQLAAVAVVVYYDAQAHYVFGCSSNEFRNIAPAYKLQWECIKAAQKAGMDRYNFGGIHEGQGSALRGVTEFKKRFRGHEVHHEAPLDIVLRPALYRAFTLYKRVKR